MVDAAIILHEEAHRAGKFVLPAGNHCDVEFFASNINAGQVEGFNDFSVVVHVIGDVFCRLETFEGISFDLVLSATTWCIIVGCHKTFASYSD